MAAPGLRKQPRLTVEDPAPHKRHRGDESHLQAPHVTLANGVMVPQLAFGTSWFPDGRREPEVAWEAVPLALESGFVHIDTAHMYGTEPHIGAVLGRYFESRRRRSDIFITTKVAHPPLASRLVEPSDGDTQYMVDPELDAGQGLLQEFRGTLSRLKVGYVDLLLIHWPGPYDGRNEEMQKKKRSEMWNAMERIYEKGLSRAIGVSNFTSTHLEQLLVTCRVPPHVNQVEIHPYFAQQDLQAFCNNHDIRLAAYSPLTGGKLDLLADPVLLRISKETGLPPAIVVLRWLKKRGVIIVVKSHSWNRLQQNFSAMKEAQGGKITCQGGHWQGQDLSSAHVTAIDSMDRGLRTCAEPNSIA